MPLPQHFTRTDHLQYVIRNAFNKEVRQWFNDIDFDGDLDISVSRTSLAVSCSHDDDDSMLMTVARMLLFDQIRGKFETKLAQVTDEPTTTTFAAVDRRKTHPIVTLVFQEDINDVEPGFGPVSGQISFRLMDETAQSMTEAKAIPIANRIRSEFGINGGFIWQKGRNMYSYSDWSRGYQLQLLCRTKAHARLLVDKILDVQQDVIQLERFNEKVNEDPAAAFPILPTNEVIYGKSRRPPRRRPVADVRFQFARLKIEGLPNPIILVDRTGLLPPPLVEI